ncbi:hypothetical protein GWI33_005299 [Rhynchophorus ferrugineus]|uniref:Uncharacterized protein n=1 Tax=Rhynchophorus ferrugineus TaxID=354439 RepID=A0A834MG67_RHYFE|nr:hypothetical protein GWI33_005299 [Rhynchophorus ferrugineus]
MQINDQTADNEIMRLKVELRPSVSPETIRIVRLGLKPWKRQISPGLRTLFPLCEYRIVCPARSEGRRADPDPPCATFIPILPNHPENPPDLGNNRPPEQGAGGRTTSVGVPRRSQPATPTAAPVTPKHLAAPCPCPASGPAISPTGKNSSAFFSSGKKSPGVRFMVPERGARRGWGEGVEGEAVEGRARIGDCERVWGCMEWSACWRNFLLDSPFFCSNVETVRTVP